ncbi:MAG: ubiquinone biosynthesis regulatory protein kinase UbiB, partial [Burkholderiaceae bacterium]
FLERWMNEQVGGPALNKQLMKEAPRFAQFIPELPRLLHDALKALIEEQRRTNRLLQALIYGAIGFTLGLLAAQALLKLQPF